MPVSLSACVRQMEESPTNILDPSQGSQLKDQVVIETVERVARDDTKTAQGGSISPECLRQRVGSPLSIDSQRALDAAHFKA